MTCTLYHFPAPPAYVAQLEAEARRQAIVAAARAVLRSAEWQSADELIRACNDLRRHGDALDHQRADVVMAAIPKREAWRKAKARRTWLAPSVPDAALILSAAFALGMIGYVTAIAQGWW